MLTFWGLLTESEIDVYVASLLLPPYLSHLSRVPFRFDLQEDNVDGREPLLVTYLGEGRLEEYRLKPEEHAFGLLKSILPDLDASAIRFSPSGPIWSRGPGRTISTDSDSLTNISGLRVFFETTFSGIDETDTPQFAPPEAYVSVSRQELFISRSTLARYLAAWMDRIAGKNEDEEAIAKPELQLVGGGYSFQGLQLGGEFLLQNDIVFQDLLRFSGLSRALEEIRHLARLDMEAGETEISDDGIRLTLVSNPG